MTNSNFSFPAGSQWRKWDLHVHSPESANFGGDWPGFVIQLGNSDCSVIGINDYFSVAGFKELRRRLADPQGDGGNKAYRDALEKLRQKTLLPVIECRMTNVVVGKGGSGPRINFHVIFSDEVNPDDIETLIKGIRVKDQSIGSRYTDKNFLLNDVSVDFNGFLQALSGDKTFLDKYVVWIPYDEYGGIGDIDPKADKLFKEGLVHAADILGSGNKKQSDFFLWKDPKFSEDDYRTWFGKRKPCIKGSDSHSVNEEIGRLKDQNSKPTDRCCWIKADPTFNGLRQIINEPEDRVYLGVEPPKITRVNSHKTLFMSCLKISKRQGATCQDTWFNSDIPLNHDMIAIIGNKGSGKSALADIVALAGDTSQAEHFSFLDKKKFREKKLASNFEVEATWHDGSVTTHNLQENPDPNKPEAVKYISQSYLETVCTETSVDESSAFQHELRSVIFSHIGDADRIGRATLDDLIAYKTEEIKSELARHKSDLSQANALLVGLEQKAAPAFKLQIEEGLKRKSQELAAHETNKPVEVLKPENLDDEQKQAFAKIDADLVAANELLQALDGKIQTARNGQKLLIEQQSVVTKLEARLANIESDLASQRAQAVASFTALGLDVDAVLKVEINRAPLNTKKADIALKRAAVDLELQTDLPTSLIGQQASVKEKIDGLKGQLDAPSKRFQNYLQQLAAWEKLKLEIIGAADVPGSLRYLEAQLVYIDKNLPVEIQQAKAARLVIAQEIHACIAGVRNVYAELFDPVQKLIEDSLIIKEGFKLTFASAIIQRGFRREFFDQHISQGVQGSFCGKDAGEQRLTELMEDFDFNDRDQAIAFADQIEGHLHRDLRSGKAPAMLVSEQLRKHANVQELYDFIWSFDYLIPEYSLKLDGKELSQLSPGERGALLLVFYLLVDKSDCPIIVDQPEENLDNQTVYHLLIPVIKAVKARRQIIMVTHNPNIAVVCDAEQIIHASIDRAHGNLITYTSGSIEDVTINKHILDVLEGTRPAFDNRDGKYYRR